MRLYSNNKLTYWLILLSRIWSIAGEDTRSSVSVQTIKLKCLQGSRILAFSCCFQFNLHFVNLITSFVIYIICKAILVDPNLGCIVDVCICIPPDSHFNKKNSPKNSAVKIGFIFYEPSPDPRWELVNRRFCVWDKS